MIGFRVDANEHIATGHLMRCIAIAKECKKLGEEVLFLLAEEKETQRLQEHHLPFRILHSKWDDLEAEENILKSILAEEKITRLVVDSYQATKSYLRHLNEQVPVLYVDDMGKEVYLVSAVLHYSEFPREYQYQETYLRTKVNVLAGMQYTPLREEFSFNEEIQERENSILITTGGTDPFNVSGKLLESLMGRDEFKAYTFCVIIGSMNQNEAKLRQLASKDARISLYKNVKNMGEFMRRCKFAVSAGGTTLFELCASGIPTVCFSFADNQRSFTKELDEHEIMIYVGDVRDDENIAQKIVEGLICYSQNPDMSRDYAMRMKKLVDGKGAARIAAFLCSQNKEINGLRLRKAERSDDRQLYEWKNDAECVQNSLTGRNVTWEEHQAWFFAVQQRSDVKIFILEADEGSLGQIRLNIENECGVISYSIAQEYRGRQLGKELLNLAENEARQMGLKELRAMVQRYNLSSRKLFLQLGYEEILQENSMLYCKKIKR